MTPLEVAARMVAEGMGISPFLPMTDEQAAEFRKRFEEELAKPEYAGYGVKVLPAGPPPVPEGKGIRALLSEGVTAVQPGEILVIRGAGWTSMQVCELQEYADAWTDRNAPGVRILVVPGDELGVAAGDQDDREFTRRVLKAVNSLELTADSAGYVHAMARAVDRLQP